LFIQLSIDAKKLIERKVSGNMTNSIKCPSCGTKHKFLAEMVGRQVKCNLCETIFTFPSATVEEAPVLVTPVEVTPDPNERLPITQIPSSDLVPTRELTMIKSMVDRGSHLDAMQALKRVEAKLQHHPGFHYLNGLVYAGLGNYPHALDSLNSAIAGGVRTPEAYAIKGKAELELSQWKAAVESLDNALELAGTDIPDYIADLAKAYEGANMLHDSAVTWAALERVSPNHMALITRRKEKEERQARQRNEQVQQASLQMQKEQRASDTACWVCIILRILLECL